MIRFILSLCVLFSLTTSVWAAKLAVIIDDVGYHASDSALMELPRPVALSVIPYTEFASRYAQAGFEAGHPIMLHLPMQTQSYGRLEQGGLTVELAEIEFRNRIQEALKAIPQASGVNNHMGSFLTAQRQQMNWLMDELAQAQRYFVDSRTTKLTQAEAAAIKRGLPNTRRNVFLDNVQTVEAIQRQLNIAYLWARKHGSAVIIGHPYPQTIQVLKEALFALPEDIELVPITDLLKVGQEKAAHH